MYEYEGGKARDDDLIHYTVQVVELYVSAVRSQVFR